MSNSSLNKKKIIADKKFFICKLCGHTECVVDIIQEVYLLGLKDGRKIAKNIIKTFSTLRTTPTGAFVVEVYEGKKIKVGLGGETIKDVVMGVLKELSK